MIVSDAFTSYPCYKYNVFRHVVKKKVAFPLGFGFDIVRVADHVLEENYVQ